MTEKLVKIANKKTIGSLIILGISLLTILSLAVADKKASAGVFDSTAPSAQVVGTAWGGIGEEDGGETLGGPGWIHFNCDGDGYGCSENPYGVSLNLNEGSTQYGKFSGYAWSSTMGWLSFNPGDVAVCGEQAYLIGLSDTIPNELTLGGFARFIEVGANTDSYWDGCVGFSGNTFETTLDTNTGDLAGYAWGDNLVGWISFDCAGCNATVETVDAPTDVPTAFLSASPETIILGVSDMETTLSWNEVGLDDDLSACDLTVDDNSINIPSSAENIVMDMNNGWDGSVVIDLSPIDSPTTLTFTLENCVDIDGNPVNEPEAEVQIIIDTDCEPNCDDNPTISIDAEPEIVTDGLVDVAWSFANMQSCQTFSWIGNSIEITNAWTDDDFMPNLMTDGGSGTESNIAIGQSTGFAISCIGLDDQVYTAEDTVTVPEEYCTEEPCGPVSPLGGFLPSWIEI